MMLFIWIFCGVFVMAILVLSNVISARLNYIKDVTQNISEVPLMAEYAKLKKTKVDYSDILVLIGVGALFLPLTLPCLSNVFRNRHLLKYRTKAQLNNYIQKTYPEYWV